MSEVYEGCFKLVKVNIIKPQKDKTGRFTIGELARFGVQVCDPNKQYFSFLVSILNQSRKYNLTVKQRTEFHRIFRHVLADFKKDTGVDLISELGL